MHVFDSKTPVFLPKTCRKHENIFQKPEKAENIAFFDEKPVDGKKEFMVSSASMVRNDIFVHGQTDALLCYNVK